MDEKQKKIAIIGLCGFAIVVAVLLAFRGGTSNQLPKESSDKAKKLIDEMNANAPKPSAEPEVPSEKGAGRKPVGGKGSK